MAKIPFKVSARTARLIGRENIASSKGTIIELVKNGEEASIWCVDWRDFEGDSKTIGSVTADLSTQENLNLRQYLLDEIFDKKVQEIINQYSFDHGTVLKISSLRDDWDDYFVSSNV
ncbi:hypothetical protein [Isorropodon fossajaponicum symbiont]|uniref:hypothetical protein n=1 Tax=Isorropodon fossajaponicum symbiont TaxID=883811 RepID=UPI0019151335|nr:hypothetical protein [Isorropodon fossajaponicum symbiont]